MAGGLPRKVTMNFAKVLDGNGTVSGMASKKVCPGKGHKSHLHRNHFNRARLTAICHVIRLKVNRETADFQYYHSFFMISISDLAWIPFVERHIPMLT